MRRATDNALRQAQAQIVQLRGRTLVRLYQILPLEVGGISILLHRCGVLATKASRSRWEAVLTRAHGETETETEMEMETEGLLQHEAIDGTDAQLRSDRRLRRRCRRNAGAGHGASSGGTWLAINHGTPPVVSQQLPRFRCQTQSCTPSTASLSIRPPRALMHRIRARTAHEFPRPRMLSGWLLLVRTPPRRGITRRMSLPLGMRCRLHPPHHPHSH